MNSERSIEQGTDEWLKLKIGVISASNAYKAMAKKGTETREGYLSELVAQIATGRIEQIESYATSWGKNHESDARLEYERLTGHSVDQIAFIYGKDKRVGISPDGIIKNLKKGMEIKCPFNTKNHIDFLLSDKIKSEYKYQVQFSMYVSGYDLWDFVSFDSRMFKNKIKILTIEKDHSIMDRFENDIGEFILDMDKALEKLDLTFGSQWI